MYLVGSQAEFFFPASRKQDRSNIDWSPSDGCKIEVNGVEYTPLTFQSNGGRVPTAMPPSFIQLLGMCKLWSFNKSSGVAGIINIWFKQKHTWISCAENQRGRDNRRTEVWKIEPLFPNQVSGSCKCGKVIDRTKLLFLCLSQWFDLSDGTCSLVASTIVFVTMGSIDFCISRFGMDFCNCADAIKHNFYINWAAAAAQHPTRTWFSTRCPGSLWELYQLKFSCPNRLKSSRSVSHFRWVCIFSHSNRLNISAQFSRYLTELVI